MKSKRLLLVVLAILMVTASSAAVAIAQDDVQGAQSDDLLLPTNTTGNFDTGNKQVSIHQPGETSTNSSDQTPAWSVYIEDNFFNPADVAVEPGSTITWINNGTVPHTVTADNGLFDSGELYPGDSYTVWFGGSGTVTYYCAIHPEMRGNVIVGSV